MPRFKTCVNDCRSTSTQSDTAVDHCSECLEAQNDLLRTALDDVLAFGLQHATDCPAFPDGAGRCDCDVATLTNQCVAALDRRRL